jgi:hypothetical protein
MLREVFNRGKELADKVTNVVMNYTEVEIKVREATNDDAWGPHSTLMHELAQYTYSYEHFSELMSMLWNRMFYDNGNKDWRRIYKGLLLINYLVRHGSERVVNNVREHLFDLKALQNFECIDEYGKDQGVNVRHNVRNLLQLMEDDIALRDERKKAKTSKDKYRGFSHETSGFSKSSLGSGTFSYDSGSEDKKYQSYSKSYADNDNGSQGSKSDAAKLPSKVSDDDFGPFKSSDNGDVKNNGRSVNSSQKTSSEDNRSKDTPLSAHNRGPLRRPVKSSNTIDLGASSIPPPPGSTNNTQKNVVDFLDFGDSPETTANAKSSNDTFDPFGDFVSPPSGNTVSVVPHSVSLNEISTLDSKNASKSGNPLDDDFILLSFNQSTMQTSHSDMWKTPVTNPAPSSDELLFADFCSAPVKSHGNDGLGPDNFVTAGANSTQKAAAPGATLLDDSWDMFMNKQTGNSSSSTSAPLRPTNVSVKPAQNISSQNGFASKGDTKTSLAGTLWQDVSLLNINIDALGGSAMTIGRNSAGIGVSPTSPSKPTLSQLQQNSGSGSGLKVVTPTANNFNNLSWNDISVMRNSSANHSVNPSNKTTPTSQFPLK